ncbi:MAG: hypothetical protein HUU47_11265, partial [Bacteroidetes bacterium]|nr:hypothetical protein [Bacteroidota bacterium]
MKFYFSAIFIFIVNASFSQKEGNVWVFNNSFSINFDNGKPEVSNKYFAGGAFGTASLCLKNGRLLFYCYDGRMVFDSTGHFMDGGYLNGSSYPQNVIFISHPDPDSSNIYYAFSVHADIDKKGLSYSIIDMKMRGGRGNIVSSRNRILILEGVTSKLTAIKHPNRRDFWLLTWKKNADTIFAYIVTSKGISAPVKSSTGFINGGHLKEFASITPMKLSPDGKKLCAGTDTFSIIADFNAYTGKVSNVWCFYDNYRYMEFSPKSKFLYLSGGLANKGFIHQYNLNSKTKEEFINSKVIIGKQYDSTYYGLMQVAPDGKIYVPEAGAGYLHVINYPDSAGISCGFKQKVVYLKGKTSVGALPDMVQSFFQKKTFEYRRSCTRDTVFFAPSNTF